MKGILGLILHLFVFLLVGAFLCLALGYTCLLTVVPPSFAPPLPLLRGLLPPVAGAMALGVALYFPLRRIIHGDASIATAIAGLLLEGAIWFVALPLCLSLVPSGFAPGFAPALFPAFAPGGQPLPAPQWLGKALFLVGQLWEAALAAPGGGLCAWIGFASLSLPLLCLGALCRVHRWPLVNILVCIAIFMLVLAANGAWYAFDGGAVVAPLVAKIEDFRHLGPWGDIFTSYLGIGLGNMLVGGLLVFCGIARKNRLRRAFPAFEGEAL
jgi:hypothetical protein